ncbi:hypothetical protein CLV49_1541 [Labedella gwakjiensis]|uniref:IrrE N-terminal-like domain-containing protein n=1 Tax=Labedella gwakjiensis TaxID=390269 RepID=A0A2P8GVG5_9MICO|nr:hypothetical protein CLV49_1541 [Labedella gwakjiensis]
MRGHECGEHTTSGHTSAAPDTTRPVYASPDSRDVDIHDLIGRLGVRVEYRADLPPGRLGAYLDDERRILIRSGLTGPLERETLHHEYVHAKYRDRGSDPSAERRAERECASMLIDEREYAAAERSGLSPLGIAHQLDVPLAVVRVYQREILAGRLPDPRLRPRGEGEVADRPA